jgi:hypothetical protein
LVASITDAKPSIAGPGLRTEARMKGDDAAPMFDATATTGFCFPFFFGLILLNLFRRIACPTTQTAAHSSERQFQGSF